MKITGILFILPIYFSPSGKIFTNPTPEKAGKSIIVEPVNIHAQNINMANSTVTITFASPLNNYSADKAPLKYNKQFAYSLTLDDGLDDAYTHGFKLLNGGVIPETNTHYSGLHFTDGCGNNIPFRAGIAWNSHNQHNEDIRTNTEGNLNWTQMKEMYDAGWDIMDHSLTHSFGSGTNYSREVTENKQIVKEKLGVDMTHFVIPTGDDEYIPYAENEGFLGIYNQSGMDVKPDAKVTHPLGFSLTPLKLHRNLIEDDQHNKNNITERIDYIAQISTNEPYWYNEFTHKVGPERSGASLLFPTFEHYMQHIESRYGKSGQDNVWFASLQEVYEYLYIREHADLTVSANENILTLNLDMSRIPQNFRRHEISLLVAADTEIENISVSGTDHYTFNTHQGQTLINLFYDNIDNLTSTNDKFDFTPLKLYPNPADEFIKIVFKSKKSDTVKISLYDSQGKCCYEQITNIHRGEFSSKVDLQNQEPGIYLLNIEGEITKYQPHKIIIK